MQEKLSFRVNSEIYPPEKEKANKETVWEHYFGRKIAFLIAPFFLKINASANQISILSIFAGVVGAIFILAGQYWQVIFGACLIQVWLILDKTDGLVARYRNQVSSFGKFLEELNGEMMAVLFFSSIGFAASQNPGFLPGFLDISPSIFLTMGLLTSLSIIFRHLINRHLESVFGGSDGVSVGGNILYKIIIKFLGIYSLAHPIFILAAIFNFLGLYTAAYFLGQVIVMLGSVIFAIQRASRI
ncbi:MAG: CDP-alcohol phosphatidyltransferase family protein [Patescibacteria group bacterium]